MYAIHDRVVVFEDPALAHPILVEQRPDAPTMQGADGTSRRLWPAAIVLARYLYAHPELVRGKRVVELGAGAGAAGLVCAALGATHVSLTDEPDALPLLSDNVARNESAGALGGCSLAVLPCSWGDEEHISALVEAAGGPFDVVIACEVVYKQEPEVLQAG